MTEPENPKSTECDPADRISIILDEVLEPSEHGGPLSGVEKVRAMGIPVFVTQHAFSTFREL